MGKYNTTTPKDTLSLNANVTINNLNSSSDGTLTVTGTTYLDDNLYIRDSSNNTKITLTSSNGSGTFAGEVYVNSSINSTASNTGALLVAGGVGIGQNLNVGDNLTVKEATTLTELQLLMDDASINSTTNIDASLYITYPTDTTKFFVDHTNGNTTISDDLSIESGTIYINRPGFKILLLMEILE